MKVIKQERNGDKGRKVGIWVLSGFFIISFLILQTTTVYGQNFSETIPFMADDNGKVYTSGIPAKEAQPLLSELLKKYPGKEWKIQVEHGYVKRISVLQPLTIGESISKEFSMEFIQGLSWLFGVASEEASYLVETKLKDQKVITYLQRVSGIPVLNSHITFVFKNNNLTDITSRVYPNVRKFITNITPNITSDEACNISRNDAYKIRDLTLITLECRKGELLIVPKEYAAFIKNQKDYYLAWKISISSTQSLFSYTYFIDSTTGELIDKYSNIKE